MQLLIAIGKALALMATLVLLVCFIAWASTKVLLITVGVLMFVLLAFAFYKPRAQ
jgi:hypothetical protein